MPIPLIIADLVMLATFVLRFSRLPPQIPLFYSHPWGETQLVDTWVIALIPLILHVFYFLNLFIAKRYFPEDQVIGSFFRVANIVTIVAYTAIFLKIIFLIS